MTAFRITPEQHDYLEQAVESYRRLELLQHKRRAEVRLTKTRLHIKPAHLHRLFGVMPEEDEFGPMTESLANSFRHQLTLEILKAPEDDKESATLIRWFDQLGETGSQLRMLDHYERLESDPEYIQACQAENAAFAKTLQSEFGYRHLRVVERH